MKILRIDTSVSGDDSASRVLTQALTEHFRGKHPDAEVTELDFGTNPLPHINPVTMGAIRFPEERRTEAMKAAFPAERAVLDQFLASDIVIVGAPMYNFTISSSLKAWLDRLGVPGVTFSYSEAGPQGLAGGRRVIAALSQGGVYEIDSPFEHHQSYLRDIFRFIGIETEFVIANKIGLGPEAREQSLAEARLEISRL
jgi:FMN-dependent NADH-azoreductase